jgi:hypothetical protein
MRFVMVASSCCAVALAALGACSSTSTPSGQPPPPPPPPQDAAAVDTGVVSCQNDPRVDAFAADLTKKSASGALTATLLSATPAPPALRTNSWTVKLVDATGAPISGAALSVVPWMPDHGHGSSVVPQVTAGAAGSYTLDSLYLFMPGVWRITLGVMPDAGMPNPDDEVQFFFCIEG